MIKPPPKAPFLEHRQHKKITSRAGIFHYIPVRLEKGCVVNGQTK